MPVSFREALASRDFVVTAELPLAPASGRDSILDDAASVAAVVDGFLLTDNQYGQPHMAPAAAAGILLAAGFPPILQLCCRNRNRIALIGELLAARATGIDSLVLVRGGVLPEGYAPRPRAVMDTDAKELVATARLIADDPRLGATDWLIGTSATVHAPAADVRPDELLGKADAGARLVITQVCHDVEVLRRYMAFLIEHRLTQRLSVIVSLTVPNGPDRARWLRDNRRGTVIPDAAIEQLAAASDPATAAVEAAADLVRACRSIPGISGVNFAALENLAVIPQVLAAAD